LRPRLGLRPVRAGVRSDCGAQLRSTASALVELDVQIGLGRVERGGLVENEGVLAVEIEVWLRRAAGGREGRRCGGQVEM